jgi:hypothetical protein
MGLVNGKNPQSDIIGRSRHHKKYATVYSSHPSIVYNYRPCFLTLIFMALSNAACTWASLSASRALVASASRQKRTGQEIKNCHHGRGMYMLGSKARLTIKD